MTKKNRGVRNGRERIFEKTNYHCWYCGKNLRKLRVKDRTIDHMTPLSKGGVTKNFNLIGSCQICNCEKNDYTLEEFRDYIKIKFKYRRTVKFWGEGKRKAPWIHREHKIRRITKKDLHKFDNFNLN